MANACVFPVNWKRCAQTLTVLISIYNKLNLILGSVFPCYDMWYDQFQRVHYCEHIMGKNGVL